MLVEQRKTLWRILGSLTQDNINKTCWGVGLNPISKQLQIELCRDRLANI